MNCKIGWLNERVRPDAGHEFVLAKQLAGPLDKAYQNVQRAATERDRVVAMQQEPWRREQTKVSKRDRPQRRGMDPIGLRRHRLFRKPIPFRALGDEDSAGMALMLPKPSRNRSTLMRLER